MAEILLTICARGGSKGVKGKNLRPLGGKPLIAHSILQAKAWGRAKRIVVSTDSEAIAETARAFGAEVPFKRPDELATDASGKLPAIRHAHRESERIFGETFDIVVDLDATSPVRTPADLDRCLEIFLERRPDTLFSVVPSRKNPYFNMVELDKKGRAVLCKRLSAAVPRRQDAPPVYEMNASIYFFGRDFLVDELQPGIFSGECRIYPMDGRVSLDIDAEEDFRYLEYLLEKRIIRL